MKRCPSSYWPGTYSLWGSPAPGGLTGEYDEFACEPHFAPTTECVKKYKACYKLYKISYLRLYKTCYLCGREFDYYHHRGCCPHCH